MLTEEQIEVAARKLCELRGIDPDAMVGHGADPSPSGLTLHPTDAQDAFC